MSKLTTEEQQLIAKSLEQYWDTNNPTHADNESDWQTSISIVAKLKSLNLSRAVQDVQLFHEKFKAPVSKRMCNITEDRFVLRHKLMKEENEEYLLAANTGDIVEIADALGDMLYILCGTIIEHGLQNKIQPVFDEIQRSNMSKLGEDGEPIFREDGKILKGPNYFKPNIAKVLTDK